MYTFLMSHQHKLRCLWLIGALCLVLIVLAACSNTPPVYDGDTSSAVSDTLPSTESDTTPKNPCETEEEFDHGNGKETEGTSDPETGSDTESETEDETEPDSPVLNTEPKDQHIISDDDIGFSLCVARSSSPSVATADIDENGNLILTSYNPGEAVVSILNQYGESVSVSVLVDDDYRILSATFTPFTMPTSYVMATDYGMAPSNEDNAPYLQAAIDALPDGGVVYIPAGRYVCSFVQLKNNITLRLEGIISDYNTPFTDELAKELANGNRFAIIAAKKGDMFANHEAKGYGREGADNITISGGVFDMDGKSRCFIWCCADGILLENTIMKDCPNDHAIQITGSTNVTVRNVMFAGYHYKTNNQRAELIQIEGTETTAIGSSTVTASVFDPYEYYQCKNITIENCYFGPSDEFDSPTYAIGHHGQQNDHSAEGVRILNCTFDNPRVVAIRLFSYADVEISGCNFISDRNNAVLDNIRCMIELDMIFGAVTDGTVYYATEETRGGCNGVEVHHNTFFIGEKSLMAGIMVTHTGGISDYDARAYSDILMTDFYTTPPYSFTGYQLVESRMTDFSIHHNDIKVENNLGEQLFLFRCVSGLYMADNTIETPNEYISSELGGESIFGAQLYHCRTAEEEASTFTVLATSSNQTVPLVLVGRDESIHAYSETPTAVISFTATEGGIVDRRVTDDGTLYVEGIPDQGYRLDGYYVNGVKIDVQRYDFSKITNVTVQFSPVE